MTLQEGRPAHIACPRRKEICGEILWAAGPWRTSGDWWEQEGWARDEWDIALQEAAGITLYRLVRDLLSGQWRWRETMTEAMSTYGRQAWTEYTVYRCLYCIFRPDSCA